MLKLTWHLATGGKEYRSQCSSSHTRPGNEADIGTCREALLDFWVFRGENETGQGAGGGLGNVIHVTLPDFETLHYFPQTFS